jgi:molybdate transport system substrate-binding protein
MRNIYTGLLLLTLVVLSACSATPQASHTEPDPLHPATLTVFAAASLADAFTRIGEQFEQQYPGVRVAFNFAGSQQLVQQLAQGAPADVFASANEAQMLVAIQEGRVMPGSDQVFTGNLLVAILPPGNPADVQALPDLAKAGLRLVLADSNMPAGKYTQEFLALASQDPAFGPAFQAGVTGNIVSYEENVRAVLSKVLLGEADAGIVYRSDIAGLGPDQVQSLPIPDHLNPLAVYSIAPVIESVQTELANAFITAVQSPNGQAILAEYGFLPLP